MSTTRVAGETSTGSKRSEALFGPEYEGPPLRMAKSRGCVVWDEAGNEYLDLIMALGAVGLGYGHPAVTDAARDAIDRGGVGPLPPVEEAGLARDLGQLLPQLEAVRFLKTGAEAVAAAVRLARVHTGRGHVLGCGYHGWLDWCSSGPGIPAEIRGLYAEIPFNDIERAGTMIRQAGAGLACVVVEPMVDGAPDPEWLTVLREETRTCGALLVYDEIKTWPRVGFGGAAQRWGGEPDLLVLGKALANGFPLAAVGGRADVMRQVETTWISSTLATDFVALAAARATVAVAVRERLPERLHRSGEVLLQGLRRLAETYPSLVAGARGIPEMCHLAFTAEPTGGEVARECARRGLLFKRSAYNFVSLAHGEEDLRRALDILDDVLRGIARRP